MRNSIFSNVLFFVMLMTVLAAGAAGQEKLAFEFSEGLHWHLQSSVKQTTTQQLVDLSDEEYEHVTLEYMIFDYDFVVQEVLDDGSAWVRFTFDRIRLENERQGYYMTYDSSEDLPVPAAMESLAALQGESYELLITPAGRVEQARGLERLYADVEASLEEHPSRERMVEDVKVQFGERALREQMQMMLAIFPDEPVRLGQQWSSEFELSAGVPIVVKQQWMLRGMRGDAALINSDATIEPNKRAAARKKGVSDVRFEMSGTQSGRSEVDAETGRIIQSQKEQSLEGMLYMSMPGTDDQLEVPLRIDSEIAVKMEEAD